MRQQRGPASARTGRPRRGRWVAVVAVLILVAGVVFAAGLLHEVGSAPAGDGHHDFLAFHSAARMVAEGTPRQIYNASALTALERQTIPVPVGAAGYMPFINPPLAAALQAPLGLLSEQSARVVWLILSLPVALLACWLATDGLRRQRLLAVACLAATFPFYQAFIEGQWSFVLLLGCLLGVRALRADRPVLGGACLAVLALKPPLLIPVLVLLVCARAWRALAATLGAVAAVWLATLPWTGLPAQLDYAAFLAGVVGSHLGGAGAAGESLWHGGMNGMEGVNGLAAAYAGQERFLVVDAVTAVVLAGVVLRWAIAARRVGLGFAGSAGRWLAVAGIAAALLGDLHLYPQDCVLALLGLPELLALTGPRDRLIVVLALAVILDLVWLDQLAFTPHLLTWVLGVAIIVGTRRALQLRALPQPGRPPAGVTPQPARASTG